MSNAQSGSLNWTELLAPADAAAPSGFQSLAPARRIDILPSAPDVPLTRVKLPAPGPANAGAADNSSNANPIFLMRPGIHPNASPENRIRLDLGGVELGVVGTPAAPRHSCRCRAEVRGFLQRKSRRAEG